MGTRTSDELKAKLTSLHQEAQLNLTAPTFDIEAHGAIVGKMNHALMAHDYSTTDNGDDRTTMSTVVKIQTAPQFCGERVMMKRDNMDECYLQGIVDGLRKVAMGRARPTTGVSQACLPHEQIRRYAEEFMRRVHELDTDPQKLPHSNSASFSRAVRIAQQRWPALFQLSRCHPVADSSPALDVEMV